MLWIGIAMLICSLVIFIVPFHLPADRLAKALLLTSLASGVGQFGGILIIGHIFSKKLFPEK